jgi:hypothetical protein
MPNLLVRFGQLGAGECPHAGPSFSPLHPASACMRRYTLLWSSRFVKPPHTRCWILRIEFIFRIFPAYLSMIDLVGSIHVCIQIFELVQTRMCDSQQNEECGNCMYKLSWHLVTRLVSARLSLPGLLQEATITMSADIYNCFNNHRIWSALSPLPFFFSWKKIDLFSFRETLHSKTILQFHSGYRCWALRVVGSSHSRGTRNESGHQSALSAFMWAWDISQHVDVYRGLGFILGGANWWSHRRTIIEHSAVLHVPTQVWLLSSISISCYYWWSQD